MMSEQGYPNLSIIKRLARDNLAALLEAFAGKKDIVIDTELMKPLNTLGGAPFLKKHGVEKIFKLEEGGIDAGCDRKFYLMRPYPSRMKLLTDHIRYDRKKGNKREYIAVFTPKKMSTCELTLEEEGLFGGRSPGIGWPFHGVMKKSLSKGRAVSIDEYPVEFLPIDHHVLSLELDIFRDQYYHGSRLWLPVLAKGIQSLQLTFGTFPESVAIGSKALMLQGLIEMIESDDKEFIPPGGPEISKLILIDREVDFVTPLLSQLTYEGLVADTFGIKCGFVEFDKEVTEKEQRVMLPLTSEDRVFEEIRYMHFSGVSISLSSKARNIQHGYNKRKDLASVRELKEYVGQEFKSLSQQHKSLSLHLAASEVIVKKKEKDDFEKMLQTEMSLLDETDTKECIEYIEELMNKQVPLLSSLRLLCLLTQTRANLDPRVLKTLKLQFLQSYGYDHLVTLNDLRKAGVLLENIEKKGYFQKIRKRFNLIPKNAAAIDLRNPNDMSYIFAGGYAPLTARLVEEIVKKGAPTVEEMLKPFNVGFRYRVKAKSARAHSSTTSTSPSANKVALVVFIGGCTHSEIAGLRFLERQGAMTMFNRDGSGMRTIPDTKNGALVASYGTRLVHDDAAGYKLATSGA